jgi:hypothetical protein
LRTEILFLRSRFAAHAVHAFYQSQPEAVDRCKFEVTAYTSDVYGRDVPQTLLHFEFDRETYQKVVWARFDPANLPKIALSFEYGVYARPVMQGAE